MDRKIKTLLICTSLSIIMGATGCEMISMDTEAVPVVSLTTSKIKFSTEEVAKGDVQAQISSRGNIKSKGRYELYSSINGAILEKVNFSVFESVKKGEIIAEFYSKDVDNKIELQNLIIRKKQLELAKLKESNGNSYDIENAKLDLEIENKKLTLLNDEKNTLTLRSPIDGVITAINTSTRGTRIGGHEIVVIVEDAEKLVIQSELDLRYIEQYFIGMPVEIECSGKPYKGKVVELVTEARPELNKYLGAYVEFDSEIPEGLELNDYLNLTFYGENKEDVLCIPTKALKYDKGEYYVFVLRDGLKEKRVVEVGIISPTNTEVLSGLSEKELVVKE